MNKSNSALIVVDVQNSVVAQAFQRDEVIQNINHLVTRAREQNVPVIWVQHSNQEMEMHTDGWKIVSELKPLDGDAVIFKVHGDSFEGTDLAQKLAEKQIGRVVVAGAQTDACIRATIHGAFTRGYDTVLVSDAHTTEDLTSYGMPAPEKLIEFTNAYWTYQTGVGKTASVEKSADVLFKST